MTHWNDTMVDRPESDGAIYATGWSISALAVLGVILANHVASAIDALIASRLKITEALRRVD